MYQIERKIKFDCDRDRSFASEIKTMPGCELMDRCIQCGTCSGACPLSIYMDYPPRKIIELTRSGFKKEALSSFTIWLCASCYACTVACPKEIGITDVMYALKQRAIRDKVYPRRFPIPVLAREFFNMVLRHGRISETLLATRLFVKTQFFKLFGQQRLGINLLRTGRFSPMSMIFPESIKHRDEIGRLLSSVKAASEESLETPDEPKKQTPECC